MMMKANNNSCSLMTRLVLFFHLKNSLDFPLYLIASMFVFCVFVFVCLFVPPYVCVHLRPSFLFFKKKIERDKRMTRVQFISRKHIHIDWYLFGHPRLFPDETNNWMTSWTDALIIIIIIRHTHTNGLRKISLFWCFFSEQIKQSYHANR